MIKNFIQSIVVDPIVLIIGLTVFCICYYGLGLNDCEEHEDKEKT